MKFFKALSHEAKVILSICGSGAVALCGSSEMLNTIITKPWRESVPIVLPAIIAGGSVGGSLANMNFKKEPK